MRPQRREREHLARGGVEDARTADVGGDDRLIVKKVDALGDLGAGEFLGQGAVWHPGANRVQLPGRDHAVTQGRVHVLM
jgi:hypothetical protein